MPRTVHLHRVVVFRSTLLFVGPDNHVINPKGGKRKGEMSHDRKSNVTPDPT